MAIYHLNAKTFSRKKGQSAVAAAAYRSATKLKDQRSGEIFDYRRKKGVIFNQIIVPSSAPTWALVQEQLWNEVESAEKRKNSTVLREVEVSLPHELPDNIQQKVAIKLANEICTSHKVAAQLSIHKPHEHNNEKNIHAHIIFSTRRIDNSGLTKKTREWDDRTNGKNVVKYWRKKWEIIANEEIEKLKNVALIDCRSYKERGLNIEPTQHRGPFATRLERAGKRSRIEKKNKAIKARNNIVIEREKVSIQRNLEKKRYFPSVGLSR
ncbi:MobQ family relaxase [Oleiphilus sp. HI0086]|uniref:MobQ family relaxase n=1 Tax=Oleiphilus sp. HI0086 TaxID=1822260 RepID=UPI0007C3694E|nr:MobQ family relaxase [Oleiphilus sp. HI0086]KZZ34774.1 hypothetical protein A3756_17200 [Oleiphilus sp. HI0086]